MCSVVVGLPSVVRLMSFIDTASTVSYTLSLHDALPICIRGALHLLLYEQRQRALSTSILIESIPCRSEEHTSELQSLRHLVCRLLLEKKNLRRLGHVDDLRTDVGRRRLSVEGPADLAQ